jgi:hypothetical protein
MEKERIYYRNTYRIGNIDEYCLWELKDDQFVLVDEDQHIALPFDDYRHLFLIVEN